MLVRRQIQRHWLTPNTATSTTSVLKKLSIKLADIRNFSLSNQIPVKISRKSNVDQERRSRTIVRNCSHIT